MSWLSPPFDRELFALALRKPFGAARVLPSIILPGAVDPMSAQKLRALAEPHLRPFELADQGRYSFDDKVPDGELLKELTIFAQLVTDRPLRVAHACTLLFRKGDYTLRLEDWRVRRPQESLWYELNLDLSPSPCDDAQTVFSISPSDHVLLQPDPGQLSLVQRTQNTTRFTHYLTHRMRKRSLVQVRLALVPAVT
ncbi:MAG: hypothetical protein JST92_04430 [Deltaproteobacteria bacterium]|nr:hypothetical protein [Deltaproteobacteria bacterium]